MCDPSCQGACKTCSSAKIRPLEWRKCSKKQCGQTWAETAKWCASCGRCSLKSCAGKISACKSANCKAGLPPNPCPKAVSRLGKLPEKHYHCAACNTQAAIVAKCVGCERPCECAKCTTCSSGECCNHGSAKVCKFDGCAKEVCRSCEQKGKATGKPSGLCTEHHGFLKVEKVAKPDASNMGMLKRRSSESTPDGAAVSDQSKRRRRCSGCEGSQRPGSVFREFKATGEVFCPVCIKKHVFTPKVSKAPKTNTEDEAASPSAPSPGGTAAEPPKLVLPDLDADSEPSESQFTDVSQSSQLTDASQSTMASQDDRTIDAESTTASVGTVDSATETQDASESAMMVEDTPQADTEVMVKDTPQADTEPVGMEHSE